MLSVTRINPLSLYILPFIFSASNIDDTNKQVDKIISESMRLIEFYFSQGQEELGLFDPLEIQKVEIDSDITFAFISDTSIENARQIIDALGMIYSDDTLNKLVNYLIDLFYKIKQLKITIPGFKLNLNSQK